MAGLRATRGSAGAPHIVGVDLAGPGGLVRLDRVGRDDVAEKLRHAPECGDGLLVAHERSSRITLLVRTANRKAAVTAGALGRLIAQQAEQNVSSTDKILP